MVMNLRTIKSKIRTELQRYGIVRAGLFGSYARGEETSQSDIDILIEPGQSTFSLLDLVKLQAGLSKRLGRPVDLLTYAGINHLLRDRILAEEVRVL